MKYFSPKNILLLLLAIILIVVFGNFANQLSFPDTNWPLDKGEKVKIKTGSSVIQKFTADRDNLARINILFGNSNLDQGATLDLKVYDETCSKLVRESSYFVSGIGSDNTEDFQFSKIPDSHDKTFCLNLSFVPKVASKSTAIFVINNNMGQNKSLTIEGQNFPGQSLSMRPGYKNSNPWGDLTQLNQRMSQYKPWFLKHYFLAAIAISFVVFSLLLLAVLIV